MISRRRKGNWRTIPSAAARRKRLFEEWKRHSSSGRLNSTNSRNGCETGRARASAQGQSSPGSSIKRDDGTTLAKYHELGLRGGTQFYPPGAGRRRWTGRRDLPGDHSHGGAGARTGDCARSTCVCWTTGGGAPVSIARRGYGNRILGEGRRYHREGA